jgi:hypothetical protein
MRVACASGARVCGGGMCKGVVLTKLLIKLVLVQQPLPCCVINSANEREPDGKL